MNRLLFLSMLTVAMLLICPVVTHSTHAQTLVASQPSPQTLQQKLQTFTGTIMKSGDSFLLETNDSKASYTLDDVEKASQFEGKKVTVTGTLDAETRMIHVESIEQAA